MDARADERRLRLRYAGACRVCWVELPAKGEAIYERPAKTVRCVSHDGHPAAEHTVVEVVEPAVVEVVEPAAVEVVESGTPGTSARRELERRKAKREERIRSKHPKLGGLMLAFGDEQQSTTAWDIGALGEERRGKGGLDRLASDTLRPLHDRRIPRSKANIDHLAVTAAGVYVIDARSTGGVLTLEIEGGLFRPRVERLLVSSRDCTRLVDGVLKQVEVVVGRPSNPWLHPSRWPQTNVMCIQNPAARVDGDSCGSSLRVVGDEFSVVRWFGGPELTFRD